MREEVDDVSAEKSPNHRGNPTAARRWRELMARSPFGIAVYRPDGSVKETNDRLRQIFELTEEEAELANASYNLQEDPSLEKAGLRHQILQVFAGNAFRLPKLQYEVLTPITRRRVRKWLQGVLFPVNDRHGALLEVVAIQMDVTNLHKAEAEAAARKHELSQRIADLERLQERYRQLFENAPIMYAITRISDGKPIVADCNRLFARTLGYSKDQVIGRPLADFYTQSSKYRLLENGGYERALKGTFETSERELITKGGDTVVALLFAAPDRDEKGVTVGTRAMFVNVTGTKEAERALAESESKYRSLFEEAIDAVFLTTTEGRWIDANPAAVNLLGFESKDELLRIHIEDIFQSSRDRKKLMAILERDGYVKDYELQLKNAHGHPLIVLESSRVIRSNAGKIVGYHGILHDVTEARQLAQRLEHQAYHDSLTGLPNRAKLHLDFGAIVEGAPEESKFAMVLLDLDRFKDINDALGHHVGDTMLREIGPRLSSIDDVAPYRLYRLGGDEFALLVGPVRDTDEAIKVTSRLIEVLRRPMTIRGLTLEIGASAGVAVRPLDGSTSGELLRCADVAMYEAKRTAIGVVRYRRDFDPHTPERLRLAAELREAVAEKQLAIYYQPKVTITDRQLVGFEALVRWHHPLHGLLAAGDFIPLAEVGDVIHPLTYWVAREALAQLRRWSRRWPKVTMAINLSARVLIDRSSAENLTRIVREAKVDPTRVEFEVTETTLMTDPKVAMTTLSRLAAAGIRIGIDDFGTGYSSLSHLKQGFIQTLKIDRSFVSDMMMNEHSRAIVSATVRMSQDMNLMSVAEGVEDEETRRELENLGCNAAQGYLFSKPAPPEEIDEGLFTL